MGLSPRLQPPVNETPFASDRNQHTQAWTAHFEAVADRLQAIPAEVKHGVTDGSDAAAGDIGEYMTATSGSVALVNNVPVNVISLDLTAGDWDMSGNVQFTIGAGTHNYFGAGTSSGLDTVIQATFPTTILSAGLNTATHRYNVTATTTVWVTAQAGFAGTVSVVGIIRARRMR
jgi:hypothetical protein